MGKYTVDTGDKEYKIENKYGEVIAKIRFNPADFGILERVQGNRMAEILNTSETDIASLEAKVKESIDYVLNRKVADEIFKTTSPLSVNADGKFFCECIMEVITQIIDDEAKARQKSWQKVNKAVENIINE